MDIENLKYLRTESPVEKIHKELFQSTSEHKYYQFGLATGLYAVYEIASNLKNSKFTGEELMQILQISADDFDKEIHDYFIKMIKG